VETKGSSEERTPPDGHGVLTVHTSKHGSGKQYLFRRQERCGDTGGRTGTKILDTIHRSYNGQIRAVSVEDLSETFDSQEHYHKSEASP